MRSGGFDDDRGANLLGFNQRGGGKVLASGRKTREADRGRYRLQPYWCRWPGGIAEGAEGRGKKKKKKILKKIFFFFSLFFFFFSFFFLFSLGGAGGGGGGGRGARGGRPGGD